MVNADTSLPPGTAFGRYTLGRRLGKGGMGVVYEATHVELRKQVAIKVLLPAAAGNPEARARFVREGEAAARLRHPHVVDITDVGVHEGTPFLVMEFLDGENLFELLKREGPLAVEELADIMLPVLDGVSAAHAAGIVHRDLKPENIFLARTRMSPREPKILDFGISKLTELGAGQGLTATHSMIGTASYMSPEQAQNSKDVDARSDQYSLGVMLYEGATGRHPFAAVAVEDSLFKLLYAITQGEFAPPRSLCPTLSESFEQAVMRAMATRREDRYPSVQTLAQALLPHASPAARYTWTRVLGVAPLTVRSERSSFALPDRAHDSDPTTEIEEPTVDLGEVVTAPSVPPSPTLVAVSVQVPADEVLGYQETLSGVDTLGTSVRSIDFTQPPPIEGRRRWKLVAAAGAVVTVGLVALVGLHSTTPTLHATNLARMETPTTVGPLPPSTPVAAREVPVPPRVMPVVVPITPIAIDAGALIMAEHPVPVPTLAPVLGTQTARPRSAPPRRVQPLPLRAPTVPMRPSTPSRFPNL